MKDISYKIALSTITVLAILFLNACNKSNDPNPTGSIPTYPKNVLVEYRVSGTGVSKITSLSYTNATGGTTNLTDISIPFSVSFNRTVNTADNLGLSFIHNNSAVGNQFDVKLEIYVDNKLVKTETYEGTSSVIGAIVYFIQ
jgi:hypothetical protein